MTDEAYWAFIYAGVLSIRLHPRNNSSMADAIAMATQAANLSLQIYRQKPWHGLEH